MVSPILGSVYDSIQININQRTNDEERSKAHHTHYYTTRRIVASGIHIGPSSILGMASSSIKLCDMLCLVQFVY